VDCAYVAHPSYLVVPDDIKKVKKPLSCAFAGNDRGLPLEKTDLIESTLKEASNESGLEHECVLYPGAHHGFALRGSKKDPEENERGQKAEDQAVKWFKKWLGA
jgi:dienelactone hydrolase